MAVPSPTSRSSAVRDAVVAMARRIGPSRQMPTTRELSRTLRVSSSTLHPILKELDQRGILSLQHGKGIFVGEAVGLKNIGVVFGGDIHSDRFSPFWSLLLRAVRDQAGERDFVPRIYMDLSDARKIGVHAQLVEDVEHQKLHGLILLSPEKGQAQWLESLGLPVVVFGKGAANWSVNMDLSAGCGAGARELIARGCRSVALMGFGVLSEWAGVEAQFVAAGVGGARVVDWSYETWSKRIPGAGYLEPCAFKLVRKLIAERADTPLPDAVLSTDDTVTRGLIAALQQAGIRPGIDIQIATTANVGSPTLELFASDLITIDYDPAIIIRAMFSVLSDLTAGRNPGQNPVRIGPGALNGKPIDDSRPGIIPNSASPPRIRTH